MVFSSLIFLFFFLPAALFCYYIVPQNFIRVRNAVLLLFSLFFYFYGEPRLIGILIFSILMNTCSVCPCAVHTENRCSFCVLSPI